LKFQILNFQIIGISASLITSLASTRAAATGTYGVRRHVERNCMRKGSRKGGKGRLILHYHHPSIMAHHEAVASIEQQLRAAGNKDTNTARSHRYLHLHAYLSQNAFFYF
jgi:hypothetical protein